MDSAAKLRYKLLDSIKKMINKKYTVDNLDYVIMKAGLIGQSFTVELRIDYNFKAGTQKKHELVHIARVKSLEDFREKLHRRIERLDPCEYGGDSIDY